MREATSTIRHSAIVIPNNIQIKLKVGYQWPVYLK